MQPNGRYILDGKEYATKEEYVQALAERDHEEVLAIVASKYGSRTTVIQEASALSAPKPLRKPYTRKPSE